MSLSYVTVREMVVEGVIRRSADPPPLDRIRMVFDASFFAINSQVAEAFAARSDKRELLRVVESLTFTAGVATLPTDVLKKYIQDCTLVTSDSLAHYAFRRYPQYIRGSNDPRLGIWTQVGETVQATTPEALAGGAIPLVGAATFSAIESPPVPATEGATFAAPDDYLPEFLDAMISYIAGSTAHVAAETA